MNEYHFIITVCIDAESEDQARERLDREFDYPDVHEVDEYRLCSVCNCWESVEFLCDPAEDAA